MSGRLVYTVEAGVAVIRLDRPEALNAFTVAMMEDFRRAADEAERDERVICVAVTGTGRGFCAGVDLSQLEADAAGGTVWGEAPANVAPDESPALFSHLLRLSKPVIAAVNGVAAGGGFVLAMMSDLRFASEDAVLTTIFSKRGLIAEHATSWLLPRQVGTSRALDLLWSSRKVGADEALRIGLVDRVVAPDRLMDTVRDYAAELAANVSPRSIAMIKRQVYDQLSQDYLRAAHECEQRMREALVHPDAIEGARSILDRRAPRFAAWKGSGV